MKHVAIHAYPFGNVGDDLFIRTLCERYPHVQFHLSLQMEYANAFHNVPNLTLHTSDSWRARIRTWIQKDSPFPPHIWKNITATVYIGGSLFIEQLGWEKSFIQMKLLQQTGKPFFIIGANFGPYRSTTFFETHEDFFKHVTSVSFRDAFSYELFSHVENVRYAPDVIFHVHKKLAVEPHPTEKNILISVIYPSVRKQLMHMDERYFTHIARLVESAVNRQYTVTLTAFCPYEKDDEAAAEIMKRVPEDMRKYVYVHVYDGDLEAVYDHFQQASIVVATRFHAMILGWIFQKKVFPITYSEKMEHVLEDIAYDGDYQPIESINDQLSTDVYNQRPTTIDLKHLAEQSEHHFSELDQLLQRE